jgi:hypothetical protein
MRGGLLWATAAIVCGMAGYAAGRSTQPDRLVEPVVIAAAPEAPRDRDVALDRTAIRAMLREELTAALAPRAAPEAADAPTDEPPAPTPDNDAAAARGRALVDAARRARRWTQDDATGLRAQLRAMTEEQRDEVLTALLPAINRGDVTMAFRGRPF